MRTRFPIALKLLLCLLANLLLLAAGGIFLLRSQFAPDHSWLVPASARPQIQAMASWAVDMLAHSGRSEWGQALKRMEEAYSMDFQIYDERGNSMGGAAQALPPEVRTLLSSPLGEAPRYQLPPPGGFPPQNPPPPGAFPPQNPPPPPMADLPQEPPNRFPSQALETRHPTTYWLLVRLPGERFRSPGPWTLVGSTHVLGQSPLLFNPLPWLLAIGSGVVLSLLIWWPFAHDMTRSIRRITRAAEEMADGQFEAPLTEKRHDELGQLAGSLTTMARRLRGFVGGQKRFLGDVAHELCSPLVRMEMALSLLERDLPDRPTPYLTDLREEVTHMQGLVNELLSFSKASLSAPQLPLQSVSVSEVVEEALRQEKCLNVIHCEVPSDLFVEANPGLLRRALSNLIRNALLHGSPPQGVSLTATIQARTVAIAVHDEGPGVPEADLPKLFDPFYRVDTSRTQSTGGSGLGLSIVKTCIEACRGTVSAANRPGKGFSVTLSLRQADHPRDAG